MYNNREEKCDVRYNMVARFLDHNNLSWQRQHLHRQMMQERYRLYGLRWATVLFLSAIRHRNVIHVNFFIFFCHICRTMVYWDPGILLARQSNVNNFSSLHQANNTDVNLCMRNAFFAVPSPTILNQNHPHRSQLNPVLNHTLASVVFLCTWPQVIVPSV